VFADPGSVRQRLEQDDANEALASDGSALLDLMNEVRGTSFRAVVCAIAGLLLIGIGLAGLH
jgi:hypothetical protein